MKTKSEIEFNEIIKEIHSLLKSCKFKKKGNNFYKDYNEFGHLINVQKSSWNTKEEIDFTINIGIFEPKYWSAYNEKSNIPIFPKEIDCVYRERIGNLKSNKDLWYKLDKYNRDVKQGVMEDINLYALPFFERVNTYEKLLHFIEHTDIKHSPLAKLILFAENNEIQKAKSEYLTILNNKTNETFKNRVIQYGKKYHL